MTNSGVVLMIGLTTETCPLCSAMKVHSCPTSANIAAPP